jgi:acyl dehydratase
MPIEDLCAGDCKTQVLVEDLSRTQLVQYAGASGDYNPLHTDDRYATEVAGFPSVFAHGMLTMGMTGRVLTDWVGTDRLIRYGARFLKQVWPGDALISEVTVETVHADEHETTADFSIITRNGDGETVMTGTATARLDP